MISRRPPLIRLEITPEQEAVLRNPTVEGAMKFWPHHIPGMEKPEDDTVVLAGVHKARLHWPRSTKQMVQESKQWLRENGYRDY